MHLLFQKTDASLTAILLFLFKLAVHFNFRQLGDLENRRILTKLTANCRGQIEITNSFAALMLLEFLLVKSRFANNNFEPTHTTASYIAGFPAASGRTCSKKGGAPAYTCREGQAECANKSEQLDVTQRIFLLHRADIFYL